MSFVRNATHRLIGQHIQPSGTWHYGSCNIQLETDVQLCQWRNNMSSMCRKTSSTHTYKQGCKKKPATEKEEPKTAKTKSEPTSAETKPAKSVLKKILSPDTKLDVPEKPYFEELPMKSSGQSSGSKDGIPACPEPQPDEHEVKTESKEPSKQNLWENRHRKEHCHSHFRRFMKNSNHQLNCWNLIWSTTTCRPNSSRREHQLWCCQRTSTNRLSNHVTHVPRQRSHHLALRFQESGVKFLENLVSLIMEKFPSNQLPNFNSFWFRMVQLLWPLHMLYRIELIPWRSLIFKNTLKRISWIQNTSLLIKHLWALNWKSTMTINAKTSYTMAQPSQSSHSHV